MEYANTFKHELSLLKSRVIESIETQLKRVGKILPEDGDIDFFTFKITVELGIEGIDAEGNLLGTEGTIRGYIEDDQISLEDAIDLLEDLEHA